MSAYPLERGFDGVNEQLSLLSQRTGCDFTKDVPDYQQCDTGGCNGGLECDPDTGEYQSSGRPFADFVVPS